MHCAVPGVTTWVALHANHPREFTPEARAMPSPVSLTPAFRLSASRCCCAASNDDASTLEALMRTFVECRVKPYYLHHGDLAPGTAHLRTTIAEGAGSDDDAARQGVGPVPARLCARYSRRLRQGSGWLRPMSSPTDGRTGRTASAIIAARCIFIRPVSLAVRIFAVPPHAAAQKAVLSVLRKDGRFAGRKGYRRHTWRAARSLY